MDDSHEVFQIPLLVVVGIIIVVCMCYGVIFFNPQASFNPFKPILPTPTFVVLVLPPTWTPTSTDTPTPTHTLTPTQVPSTTPTVTDTPTNTTVPTRTRTRTPRPPTPVPSPFVYNVRFLGCNHSGGTFIEGTVYGIGGGYESGARVRLSNAPGSGEIQTLVTGTDRTAGYYTFVINANGASVGTYYVWIVDGSGRAISDPNAGRVTINGIRNGDDPSSCWQAFIDFVHK
jgi:hypothetical protein